MPALIGSRRGIQDAVAPCAEARAYLARTTGLTGTFRTAQIRAINKLVASGAWSIFDIIWFLAGPDSTNAVINAVSSSFTATITGSPTFTVGRGFTGLVGAGNHLTGPNENALSKYVRDSAHISVFMGAADAANNAAVHSNGVQRIVPNNAGTAIARINCSAGAASGSSANSGRGYYLGTRTGSASYDLYVNGALVDNDTTASVALGANAFTLPQSTSTRGPISIATFGSDATAYQEQMYNIFAEYMTAMGATVP